MFGGRVLQRFAQRIDAIQRRCFQSVELLAQFAFEFGGNALEFLHQDVQLAFFAENPDAEIFDFGSDFGFESLDLAKQFVDSVGHILIRTIYCLSIFVMFFSLPPCRLLTFDRRKRR